VPKQLTYANVTATLALFVALGGTSYAAVKITGKDVANSSLTTKDVKNRSLLGRDFKLGQLPAGLPGAQGAKGDRGAQGLRGVPGDDGAPGAPGSAAAFATVDQSGGLYASPNSKNVDRATKVHFDPDPPVTGAYCVHSTVPVNHIVATLYGGAGGEITAVPVTDINCATGHGEYNVSVHTFDSAGVAANRSFTIAIN
jgi:hypothetical protein